MDSSILAEKGVFIPDQSGDFRNESAGDKYFRIELTNTGDSAEDRVIALCPGRYTTAAELTTALGFTVNAIIGDGDIIDTANKVVNCTGEPGTVKSWVRDFTVYPTRFTGMSIEVNSTTQLSQIIKTYRDDPYVQNPIPGQNINPNTYKSNQNFNDKLVHIPLNHYQFDYSTIVVFTLKAGATATFTFNIGARFDQGMLLDNEARKSWQQFGISGRSYQKK